MANIFFTLLFFCLYFIEARSDGFSIDIIHRQSLLSPYYNSSHDRFKRVKNAYYQSISRATGINSETELKGSEGEYLMKYSIGTPPVEVYGAIDTASDLTWLQCMPCRKCYQQTTPVFNPRSSSSYKGIPCQSSACRAVGTSECGNANSCPYTMSYGDGSYSTGYLSSDTLVIGAGTEQPISVPRFAFGCGQENEVTHPTTGSGIVGLAGGPLSVVNQLGAKFAGGKFAYCLLSLEDSDKFTSKIKFGTDAIVPAPGAKVATTPFIYKQPDTFYYLTLKAMSVSGRRAELGPEASGAQGPGNIIIDSGTTLTLLPRRMYQNLEYLLKLAIGARPVKDPEGLLSLCYTPDRRLPLPNITAHFEGGADVPMPPSSTFVHLSPTLMCLAMIPTDDLPIFGSLSQVNFIVGFDLKRKEVSFKHSKCNLY